MPEILFECKRKARKPHSCSYCGGIIEKGKNYDYAKLKYDDLYEWKSHEECSYIANALWQFIDPYDGMTEDDFQEGCTEFCGVFICTNCSDMDNECNECSKDERYCVGKIYEKLQTYDLKKIKADGKWMYSWVLVQKKSLERIGK